jgi:hypothetical protein
MCAITDFCVGFVNQVENYRRLQNVGAKTKKKIFLTKMKVFGWKINIKSHSN